MNSSFQENADSLLCRAAFVISVDADTRVVEYFFSGQKEVQLKAPEGDADKWDLYERGARLFLYPVDVLLSHCCLSTSVHFLSGSIDAYD